MYKKKGFSSYSFGIDTKIDLYVDKISRGVRNYKYSIDRKLSK